MRRILKFAAETTAAVATAAIAVGRAVANVVYSPTVQSKVAQGGAEISNSLYTGSAYSPYTAENAYRAQYQTRDTAKGLDR